MKQLRESLKLKSILSALLLFTLPAMAVDEEEKEIDSLNTTMASINMPNDDVIMYSDEIKNIKKIYNGKKPEEFKYESNCYVILKKILELSNFKECFLSSYYFLEDINQSLIYFIKFG